MYLFDAGGPARGELLAQSQVQSHVQEGIDAALLDGEFGGQRLRILQQRLVFRDAVR